MTLAGSPVVDTLVLGHGMSKKSGMTGSKRKRRRSRDENRRRFEEAANLYLDDCYARRKPVSVKEFAATHIDATRPYLSRMAPQVVGTTIGNYFRSHQLARAEDLLRRAPKKTTMLQIAMACAFGSPWTFTRHFREAFGATPGKYRAQMAERERRRK
jgi:AraC-like DNA-binding protein